MAYASSQQMAWIGMTTCAVCILLTCTWFSTYNAQYFMCSFSRVCILNLSTADLSAYPTVKNMPLNNLGDRQVYEEDYKSRANVKVVKELPEPLKDVEAKRVFDAVIKQSSNFTDIIYPSEMTMITAFFDIGVFKKGSVYDKRKPNVYYDWVKSYGYIDNPLVVFTDSIILYDIMAKLREHFPKERTIIYLLDRTKLWSFSLASRIKEVFAQPTYPVHYPNTVNEKYSCTVHAKFELVHAVVSKALFKSHQYCWIDLGYFRSIAHQKNTVKLQVPAALDSTKVAYSEVFPFRKFSDIKRIIYDNINWIAGGMFIGTPEVLQRHTTEYRNGIIRLLKNNLMSTEQQVIYYMYQPLSGFDPRVRIQTFSGSVDNAWFYLGYLCIDTWQKHIS